MRPTYAIAALVLLTSFAYAETTRFDPPDPRLDKKVTLMEMDAKLEDVAASLSKQSGVVVKAGTSTRDWKVREQHVTIYAKDVPLSTILDQIYKLHSYRLSREGKDKEWSYIIWQDKKSRELEAEMLSAENEAQAQRAKESRQAMADLAKKAAEMSPEEAKKLRDKDPNLAYMGGTKSGRGFAQLLNSLSQTDYDLMMRGKRVTIPFSSLPPNLQKAAMDTATGGLAMLMDEGASDRTPLQLVISPLREDVAGELVSMGCGGAVALMGVPKDGPNNDYDPILGTGMPMSIFLMSKPDSRFGESFARAVFDAEQGIPKEQIEKALNDMFGNEEGMAQATAHDSPTEKNPPTDPELLREVDLGKKLVEYAKQTSASANSAAIAILAEESGYAVMLESFPNLTNMVLYLQPGKQPLYKILVALEKAGFTWTRDGKALRIKSEDWAIRRSYAIAESTLVYWRDRLEQQGWFTLDDAAAMVSGLTDDQIHHTLCGDPDLQCALQFVRGDKDHEKGILRLYASLTPAQKEAMATKEGLRFSELSDRQWDHVAPIIMDRLGGISIADGCISNGWQKPDSEQSLVDTWRFKMKIIGDDQQQHDFDIVIPHMTAEQLAPEIGARKKAREAQSKAADGGTKPAQPVPNPK